MSVSCWQPKIYKEAWSKCFLFFCFLEPNLAKSSYVWLSKGLLTNFCQISTWKIWFWPTKEFSFKKKKAKKTAKIIIPSGTYHKNLAIWILFLWNLAN